ncbi:MAG: DoxX family protein [Gemmatimonadaceae bacterium]
MSTSRARITNRFLWTAQGATALLFLFTGAMKFIMPAEKMQQGPIVLPLAFLYFVGACECLGALGLILPSLLRVRTVLTPLAAAGLTIIMIGATTVTIPAMGVPAAIFPAVVGVLTAWIAYGRTRLVPIADSGRHVFRFA